MSKKSNKSASIDSSLTLSKLSEMYLEHMEADGKSVGTCFSYTMELKSAIAEIGGDTIVSEITPKLIEQFNTCDRVMRLKSGKPKAEPSFMKTRRVIRLALTWAAQNGLIVGAPYPAKDEVPTDAATPTEKTPKTRKTKRVEPETNETSVPVEVEAPAV